MLVSALRMVLRPRAKSDWVAVLLRLSISAVSPMENP